MLNILGKNLEAKQEQQLKYVVLTLIIGVGFYFLVYLPEQARQQLEMTIQETISKVTKAQSHEYSSLLTTCQNYLKWEREGDNIQKEALENMKEELDKAINWLIQAEKHLADQNQQARTEEEKAKERKELEMIKKKKFHWRRNKKKKSWTEDWLARKKDSFENVLRRLGGTENINTFDVAADYNIHFPPYLWNKLSSEQQKLAKSKGHGELELDDKNKKF